MRRRSLTRFWPPTPFEWTIVDNCGHFTYYIKRFLARVVCHFQNKRTVKLCVGTKKFELLWKSTQFQVTCSFGPLLNWLLLKSKDVLLCLKVFFFQKVLMHLSYPQTYKPFIFLNLKIWILLIIEGCASQPRVTFLLLQASKLSNLKTSSI